MTNISHNDQIKAQFLKTNRNLTFALLLLVIAASAIFWLYGVDVQGASSVVTGLVLLVLAVVFYKLPHISYLIMKYRQQNSAIQTKSILDDGWTAFKRWLEQSGP
jgi:membrane protein YdbS with pleckstrin-like domain